MEDITTHESLNRIEEIYVHTGNLACWREIKHLFSNPSSELQECMRQQLSKWKPKKNINEISGITENNGISNYHLSTDGKTLICRVDQYCHPWHYSNTTNGNGDTSNRKELKLTLKLFLLAPTEDYENNSVTTTTIGNHQRQRDRSLDVDHVIQLALEELQSDYIDSLIISFPPGSFISNHDDDDDNDSNRFRDEILKPVWTKMESLVESGKVTAIGVADIDVNELSQLYDWAKIKPTVNHYSVASCCSVPPELSAYVKARNIQLLTHNDPPDFLPQEKFREILKNSITDLTDEDASKWSVAWVARYTVMIQCRSVISNKAFIVDIIKS